MNVYVIGFEDENGFVSWDVEGCEVLIVDPEDTELAQYLAEARDNAGGNGIEPALVKAYKLTAVEL